jgi:hypothetical protein
MRRIAIAALFIFVASSALISSCSDKEPQGLSLEETPILSGGLGWGVISIAYARLMLDASSEAPDSGTARRGEVCRIVARSRSFSGRDAGVWYRVELGSSAGWLRESALSVYQSEAEARKASEVGS